MLFRNVCCILKSQHSKLLRVGDCNDSLSDWLGGTQNVFRKRNTCKLNIADYGLRLVERRKVCKLVCTFYRNNFERTNKLCELEQLLSKKQKLNQL